jgi:hypothetical protein
MQMGWRGDRDGIHAEMQERIDIADPLAAEGARNKIPLLVIRIGNSGKFNPGHIGEDPRMV